MPKPLDPRYEPYRPDGWPENWIKILEELLLEPKK